MDNFKLLLEYDGTAYRGFQKQPGLPTIQGALEEALQRVASLESPLYAAGRTDAGVHARGQVVSFHGSIKPPLERFAYAASALLPPDIVVRSCEEVGEDFHARRSAKARAYVYYLHLGDRPSPFTRRFSHYCRGALDAGAVQEALQLIIGVHDFTSFCRREEGPQPLREVFEARMLTGSEMAGIMVKANAFAWMMMRMLCGSLLQVGMGRWPVDRFREVLEAADNSLAAPSLPPRGLVLEKVFY